ncbi:hypothetical protein DM02DRAFT_676205 [Periconia macrospinosa]|uniref:F-box domain-containing protein n=1 Tax=Periconia macrospinosa TaxID=97972 RepID=A0A2V1D8E2_9PLEO|nr:hypothetical protein DM02DRAFT_676205 [Periconia macrospinosa]
MGTTSDTPPLEASAPDQLSNCPNEILGEIVSYLDVPSIRKLARASKKLRSFATDYLDRLLYNTGILGLPPVVISGIASHLNTFQISRFARVSQKLYSNLMKQLVAQNLEDYDGALLPLLARHSLTQMAQQMVDLGRGQGINRYRDRLLMDDNPLCIAAHYGHTKMVKLLLAAGAHRALYGTHKALGYAITGRHVGTAKVLSRGENLLDIWLDHTGESALQKACRMRLVSLVRYYLNSYHCHHVKDRASVQDCSIALRVVRDSRHNATTPRLKEADFQIVSMLLKCGANLDFSLSFRRSFGPLRIFSDSRVDKLLDAAYRNPGSRKHLKRARREANKQSDPQN